MRGLHFAFAWYAAAVSTFIFCLLLLIHLSFVRTVSSPTNAPYQLYRSLPEISSTSQEVKIEKGDARTLIIENFFREHKAPLADYAQDFVDTADQYGLDFRLLPAIAMQESNGGKRIPQGSNNPFGYGVYGPHVLKFSSFDEAIDRVGRGLKEDYLEQGLKTPFQIMAKYTPPALEKGGSWGLGVTAFMEQLL